MLRSSAPGASARTRTGPPASPAPRPSTSTSATGRWPAGTRFTQSDVEARHQGGGARPDRGRQALRPGADPVGQLVRIKNVPFQVVGVLATKGQSPMGQDYDDAVFVPSDHLPGEDPGRAAEVPHRASIIVSAVSPDDTHARADADHRRCCASATTSQPGADDDFSIRNLAEMASAQQEGTQDADHAARRASPRCRCWSAASGS